MISKKADIKVNIDFHFEQTIRLLNRRLLKTYIFKKIKIYKNNLEQLSIVFCSDDYLLNINRDYLKHDYYTDIITFDLSDKKNFINGELYISVDRIKENAILHQCTVNNELHRVIFHGVLHLLGYKDKTATEQKRMKEAENEWLEGYFI